MSESGSYRVSDEVLTAHLQGEAVLLHLETKNYYRLNATAAAVFQGLERRLDRAGLVDDLCARFEVSREEADAALDTLLEDLSARGLVVRAGESA